MSFATIYSWNSISQRITNVYNAAATIPANTGLGSSAGALFNSVNELAMELQQQISYLIAISRLQNCTNIQDAASFVSPFGITPITATFASTNVVLTAPSAPGSNVNVPAGFVVQTPDGIQFATTAAVTLLSGQTQVTANVQAVNAGSSGNVGAQTITQIVSTPGNPAPGGINQCSNASAVTNGSDGETVSALIARFTAFISSRWATAQAVAAAVASAQSGLTYQIGDQLDPFGVTVPNFVSIIVNQLGQSTGPSGSTITAIVNAVENSRPAGVPYTVVGPTLVPVTGVVTATLVSGANPATVTAALQAAYASYINNIGLNNVLVTPPTLSLGTTTLSFAKLLAVLLAVPGVANIPNSAFTLNGGTSDITAPYGSQIVSLSLSVTTQ